MQPGIQKPEWHGTVDALAVDLYDHDAAAPVLDSAAFYADCRALLTEDGCLTVNLFGRSSSYERSLDRSQGLYATMPCGPSKATRGATPWCWPSARHAAKAPSLLRAPRHQERWACRPPNGCGCSSPWPD